MKQLLTKHWLAKLLSLLLAIGIWFLINNRIKSSDTATGGKNVPTHTSSR